MESCKKTFRSHPITLKKTNNITLIKGWRKKHFNNTTNNSNLIENINKDSSVLCVNQNNNSVVSGNQNNDSVVNGLKGGDSIEKRFSLLSDDVKNYYNDEPVIMEFEGSNLDSQQIVMLSDHCLYKKIGKNYRNNSNSDFIERLGKKIDAADVEQLNTKLTSEVSLNDSENAVNVSNVDNVGRTSKPVTKNINRKVKNVCEESKLGAFVTKTIKEFFPSDTYTMEPHENLLPPSPERNSLQAMPEKTDSESDSGSGYVYISRIPVKTSSVVSMNDAIFDEYGRKPKTLLQKRILLEQFQDKNLSEKDLRSHGSCSHIQYLDQNKKFHSDFQMKNGCRLAKNHSDNSTVPVRSRRSSNNINIINSQLSRHKNCLNYKFSGNNLKDLSKIKNGYGNKRVLKKKSKLKIETEAMIKNPVHSYYVKPLVLRTDEDIRNQLKSHLLRNNVVIDKNPNVFRVFYEGLSSSFYHEKLDGVCSILNRGGFIDSGFAKFSASALLDCKHQEKKRTNRYIIPAKLVTEKTVISGKSENSLTSNLETGTTVKADGYQNNLKTMENLMSGSSSSSVHSNEKIIEPRSKKRFSNHSVHKVKSVRKISSKSYTMCNADVECSNESDGTGCFKIIDKSNTIKGNEKFRKQLIISNKSLNRETFCGSVRSCNVTDKTSEFVSVLSAAGETSAMKNEHLSNTGDKFAVEIHQHPEGETQQKDSTTIKKLTCSNRVIKNGRVKHLGKFRKVALELKRLNSDFLEIDDENNDALFSEKKGESLESAVSSCGNSINNVTISPENVTNLIPDDINRRLARIEKDYHQTVMKSNNEIIFCSSFGERNKRVRKLPKKFQDVVLLDDSEVLDPHRIKKARCTDVPCSSNTNQVNEMIQTQDEVADSSKSPVEKSVGESKSSEVDTNCNTFEICGTSHEDLNLITEIKPEKKSDDSVNRFFIGQYANKKERVPSSNCKVTELPCLEKQKHLDKTVENRSHNITDHVDEFDAAFNDSDEKIFCNRTKKLNSVNYNLTLRNKSVFTNKLENSISSISASGKDGANFGQISNLTDKTGCNKIMLSCKVKSKLGTSKNNLLTNLNSSGKQKKDNIVLVQTSRSILKPNHLRNNNNNPPPVKLVDEFVKLKYAIPIVRVEKIQWCFEHEKRDCFCQKVTNLERKVAKKRTHHSSKLNPVSDLKPLNVTNEIKNSLVKYFNLPPKNLQSMEVSYDGSKQQSNIEFLNGFGHNKDHDSKRLNDTIKARNVKHSRSCFIPVDVESTPNDTDKRSVILNEINERLNPVPRIESIMTLKPEEFLADDTDSAKLHESDSLDLSGKCDVGGSEKSAENLKLCCVKGGEKAFQRSLVRLKNPYKFFCIYLKCRFSYVKFTGGSIPNMDICITYSIMLDLIDVAQRENKCVHRPLLKLDNSSTVKNAKVSFGMYALPKLVMYFGPYKLKEPHQLEVFSSNGPLSFVSPALVQKQNELRGVQGRWWYVDGETTSNENIMSALNNASISHKFSVPESLIKSVVKNDGRKPQLSSQDQVASYLKNKIDVCSSNNKLDTVTKSRNTNVAVLDQPSCSLTKRVNVSPVKLESDVQPLLNHPLNSENPIHTTLNIPLGSVRIDETNKEKLTSNDKSRTKVVITEETKCTSISSPPNTCSVPGKPRILSPTGLPIISSNFCHVKNSKLSMSNNSYPVLVNASPEGDKLVIRTPVLYQLNDKNDSEKVYYFYKQTTADSVETTNSNSCMTNTESGISTNVSTVNLGNIVCSNTLAPDLKDGTNSVLNNISSSFKIVSNMCTSVIDNTDKSVNSLCSSPQRPVVTSNKKKYSRNISILNHRVVSPSSTSTIVSPNKSINKLSAMPRRSNDPLNIVPFGDHQPTHNVCTMSIAGCSNNSINNVYTNPIDSNNVYPLKETNSNTKENTTDTLTSINPVYRSRSSPVKLASLSKTLITKDNEKYILKIKKIKTVPIKPTNIDVSRLIGRKRKRIIPFKDESLQKSKISKMEKRSESFEVGTPNLASSSCSVVTITDSSDDTDDDLKSASLSCKVSSKQIFSGDILSYCSELSVEDGYGNIFCDNKETPSTVGPPAVHAKEVPLPTDVLISNVEKSSLKETILVQNKIGYNLPSPLPTAQSSLDSQTAKKFSNIISTVESVSTETMLGVQCVSDFASPAAAAISSTPTLLKNSTSEEFLKLISKAQSECPTKAKHVSSCDLLVSFGIHLTDDI